MSIAQQTQPARPLADIVTDLRDVSGHATKVLTDVRADADEKIHALKVTATRLAEDLAEARQTALNEQQRANQAEAAGIDMANTIADSIRREEALETKLRRVKAEAAAEHRVNLRLQDALDEKHLELRRTSEQYADLFDENRQLRTELDDAITRLAAGKHGRFWRGR